MQVIKFKADEELVEKLDALAAEQHATRSELIRYAVERYVETEQSTRLIREAIEQYVEGEAQDNEAPSAYEALKDVIGSVEGPGDLATNPKHMEGYGQ